ncbi:MAG: hypothetical protein ABR567_18005 [Myxococcales bacterium]|nr:hypothetical protein [Myxococcales bacterium]
MTSLLVAALLAIPPSPRSRTPRPGASQPQQEQLSPEEVRQRVRDYLGAIDTPITAEQWRALGPQAAGELEAIATDPKAFPSRRAKALDGLTEAAPDRAARLVGPMARDDKQPTAVRVAAMQGAGRVLAPDAAERELKPVLQSARSSGLRRAAADVLSRNKAGCAAVRQQASRERAEHRAAWKDVLDRCAE